MKSFIFEVLSYFSGKTMTKSLFALSIASFLLAGCGSQRDLPDCSEAIETRLEPHGFELFDSGYAQNKDSKLFATRCAAGQVFRNYRCTGDSLKMSWDDAVAYATEVADKSGEAWRLPNYQEMQSLLVKQCINPAANPFVFPDMEVTNFWTASKGWHQDRFRCAVYSYQGRAFCRHDRELEQPFFLVRDGD